ncbi:MAG: hypothetical protein FWF24_06280 [Alphaproteobacteria bacterium]|nr:hypothetical protein [Alphaproteobacteria bacterium]
MTPEQAPKRPPRLAQRVRAVLTELMESAESDSVRIAAAKALMERVTKTTQDEEQSQDNEQQERQQAIIEARTLLAELAFNKSSGFPRAPALDQSGKAAPNNA